MKLTCVTATFNCIKAGNRERLIRCIESVAKLKTEHEHLIYDGASTDGTVELLHELEAKTPGLKIVSEPDTGIYNALNKGVRDAKGEWFYVLGCDDCIYPEVLDGVLAEYDCDEIVSSVDTDKKPKIPLVNLIFMATPYCHQGTVAKTSRIRSFGGFDETYDIAADFDLILKFHENALDIQFVDSVFAFFSTDGVSSTYTEKMHREFDLLVAKHFRISPAKAARRRRKNRLPTLAVFPYVWHGDKTLRRVARWTIKENIKDWLRILFYPVVWATRPLRHRKG